MKGYCQTADCRFSVKGVAAHTATYFLNYQYGTNQMIAPDSCKAGCE